jgi:hypothetical protein
MRLLRWTAACTLALAAASPAFAQEKVTFGPDGDYTVTEEFLDELTCVADMYRPEVLVAWGKAIVDGAVTPDISETAAEYAGYCGEAYLWSDAEQEFAGIIGENQAIYTYQLAVLQQKGVSEDQVIDAWLSLSVADRVRFLRDGWGADEPFMARLRAALTAKGVPATDADILDAAIAAGAQSYITSTRERWVNLYRKP